MIYGAAGDRNLSRLLALLARLRRAPWPRAAPLVVPVPGGGRQLQQPVHVGDLADAVLTSVERRSAAGRGYDVAGPEPLAFADVLRASADAVASRIALVPIPLAPVIAATRAYERISRSPRIRVEQWQRLAEDKSFPIDAAARDLDYTPRAFSDGIYAEAAALHLRPSSGESHAQHRKKPARSGPRPAGSAARPGQAAEQFVREDAPPAARVGD
jgi:nucleoside-diphosphate-sugar epimerase